MPIRPLETAEAVDACLAAPLVVLFKHSPRCSISAWAWEQVEVLSAEAPGLDVAWVDVVAHRALARQVAATTGIAHASPQVLVLREGEVVYDASHMEVTKEGLLDAVSEAQSGQAFHSAR